MLNRCENIKYFKHWNYNKLLGKQIIETFQVAIPVGSHGEI